MKPFSEKQQELLASIVPGLKSGTIGCNWLVMFDQQGTSIFDQDRQEVNFNDLGWNTATRADFRKFQQYGLFSLEKTGKYSQTFSLDEVAIVKLCERGFEVVDDNRMITLNDFSGSTFSGIANINSSIFHSVQQIENSSLLDEHFKTQLTALMARLTNVLDDLPPEYIAQVTTISRQAARLAEDVSTEPRDKNGIKISLEGLRQAAENLASVSPLLVPIVMEIMEHIGTLL